MSQVYQTPAAPGPVVQAQPEVSVPARMSWSARHTAAVGGA
ncbi:MAG TPA: hypothetical protein VND62_11505 [Acidimicrobiales bacterium]|nr:hypothetical protein [Acidimicrobiales bacterium]